jgi:predicted N-acetyltransferase YhbS
VYQIVPLSHVPAADIDALLDSAFGADRKSRTAYKMRQGAKAIERLSFAAVGDEGTLLGSLQSWPVMLETLEGAEEVMTLVGPVAVDPACQRSGIGRALMARLIDAAHTHGHDALIMIGDPEYYGRFFGFSAEATGHWIVPGPVDRHRLLARITRPGGVAAEGRVIPPHRFG